MSLSPRAEVKPACPARFHNRAGFLFEGRLQEDTPWQKFRTLSVVVHAANIYNTKDGISTARRAYERYPSIQKPCADDGYRDAFVSDLKEQLDFAVDISEKIEPNQWEILPCVCRGIPCSRMPPAGGWNFLHLPSLLLCGASAILFPQRRCRCKLSYWAGRSPRPSRRNCGIPSPTPLIDRR